MFRVCVFPGASRPKMLQEFFQKFGKIRENAPDPTFIGRARGGPHLFWGLHDILFCIKGPHIIDSLKSKNLSNFFSPKCEKSENFQSWIWKFSTTSSDHHAAEFFKQNLWNSWKILEKFLKNSWNVQSLPKTLQNNFASLAKFYKLAILQELVLGWMEAKFCK